MYKLNVYNSVMNEKCFLSIIGCHVLLGMLDGILTWDVIKPRADPDGGWGLVFSRIRVSKTVHKGLTTVARPVWMCSDGRQLTAGLRQRHRNVTFDKKPRRLHGDRTRGLSFTETYGHGMAGERTNAKRNISEQFNSRSIVR